VGALLADDGEIATVLLLLAVELGPDRLRAVAAGCQEANEDLLAQRGWPSRPSRQPRAERALAARREPEEPPRPGSPRLVTTHDEALALEVAQQLVDSARRSMPERSQLGGELLDQLVAVRFSFAEQREQCVAERHR
jgi:hypothetical protein